MPVPAHDLDPGAPSMCKPQVFNVAGYYGADQAVCSLYALGRLGGTVIDIGHGKIGAQLLIGMCRRC